MKVVMMLLSFVLATNVAFASEDLMPINDSKQQISESETQEDKNRAKEYINWVDKKAKISGFKGLWNYEKAIENARYCYLSEGKYKSGEINFEEFTQSCTSQMASSVKHYNSILSAFLYIYQGTENRNVAKERIKNGIFETNFELQDQKSRLNEIKNYIILDPLLEFPGFQFINTDTQYAYYGNGDYKAYVMIQKNKLTKYGKNIDLYNSVDTNYFKVKKLDILRTLKPWGEKTGYVVTALEIEPLDLKDIPQYKNEYKPL